MTRAIPSPRPSRPATRPCDRALRSCLRTCISLSLLLVGACGADGNGGGHLRCTTSAECTGGLLCIDGRCQAGTDGGPVGDGGRVDAPGFDAGPPPCTADIECGIGGVCLDGACCGSADRVCGRSCCGDGEVCFASACVRPGDECRTAADCAEGEYCEPSLVDGPGPPGPGDIPDAGPPEGGTGVCLTPPPAGRCLALPPRCDGSPAPGETCIHDCEYRPEPGHLDAVVQWSWGPGSTSAHPNRVDVWATPAVGRLADSNCDGRVDSSDPPAVVFVSGNSMGTCCHCGATNGCKHGVLRALDGLTGTELWAVDSAEAGSVGFAGLSVALGDVDDDGGLEVVAVTGEGRIAVVDGDGTVMAVSDRAIPGNGDTTFGWGGGLSLGDMDGDGTVEVAYGRAMFRIAADGRSVTFLWEGGAGMGGAVIYRALSYFADVAEDENLELIAGNTVYRADGSVVWSRGGLVDGYTALGDFNADGHAELALVEDGHLVVLDAATGTTVAGPSTPSGTGHGGPPTVADFDGDGLPEVGVAKADFYSVHDVDMGGGAIHQLWATADHDFSSSVTGSTVFDFEGDGVAEVVYNDECFLWVYDGPTGSVRFAGLTNSFTGTEAALVADVDGDGSAEMVMIANGASPSGWRCTAAPWTSPDRETGRPAWEPPPGETAWRGITVFRDSANSWVGTRTLWNQHSYSVSNVCDEGDTACSPARPYGAIPERMRDNWTVPWLNNFRQNVQDDGIFDAPDATVALSVECSDPIELTASVRNLGAALLPAGVVVGFYVTTGGTERLLGTATTASDLFPARVELLTLTAPADVGMEDTFRARILVDPDTPTFDECDDTNNASEEVSPRCLM